MHDETALRNIVARELSSGEQLLWVGKPMPIRVMLANGNLIDALSGTMMVSFALIAFGSFSSLSSFGGMAGPSATVFSLFSLFPLFFIILAVFTVSKPIYTFLMAGHTVYGLTDRRALIIKPTLTGGKNVESYTDSAGVERRDIAGGKGDLVFQRELHTYRSNRRTRVRTRKIGFFGIPNVQEVEAMMLRTFEGRG